MNWMLGFILTLGLAQAAPGDKPQLVLADTFLFKAMGEIVSVRDLELQAMQLQSFQCFYPDSLVLGAFKDFLKLSQRVNFEALVSQRPPFAAQDISFFKAALKYFKLKFYIQTQTVEAQSKQEQKLRAAGVRNKCNLAVLASDSFQKIFTMELFLRSRFIPEIGDNITSKQIATAEENVALFVDSITRQIEDQIFWKLK